MKEPLHPGKIASDLIDLVPHKPVINDLHIYEEEWREFAEGRRDINHILAYRLAQCVGGTDMAFWIKLQEDYDRYKERNVWKETLTKPELTSEDLINAIEDLKLDIMNLNILKEKLNEQSRREQARQSK